MKRPPLEILLRGPAATAAWFAEQESKDKRMSDRLVESHLAVMRVLGISADADPAKLSAEDLTIALGACLQTAAVVAFACKDGLRGPARDAASDILDSCFDLIDSAEEKSATFRSAVEALRKEARR